jgi:hypothetical protein
MPGAGGVSDSASGGCEEIRGWDKPDANSRRVTRARSAAQMSTCQPTFALSAPVTSDASCFLSYALSTMRVPG